jgi:anti-sigma factor RsiW
MARIWATVVSSIRRALGAQAPAAITCRQFEDFIVSYLDGSLDKDASRQFESHIETCKACHEYLAAYRETIVLGRRAYDDLDEIPAAVPEDLVLAVLKVRYAG